MKAGKVQIYLRDLDKNSVIYLAAVENIESDQKLKEAYDRGDDIEIGRTIAQYKIH